MFCDKCGKKLGQGESFCTNCGNKIVAVQEEKPRCSKCGTFAAENAKFCPICGTGIKQPEEKLHCAECGALANKNAEFCNTTRRGDPCGRPLTAFKHKLPGRPQGSPLREHLLNGPHRKNVMQSV